MASSKIEQIEAYFAQGEYLGVPVERCKHASCKSHFPYAKQYALAGNTGIIGKITANVFITKDYNVCRWSFTFLGPRPVF